MPETSPPIALHSEPHYGHLRLDGDPITDEARANLRAQLEAGELDSLEFEAIVFIDGPNANYYRFRSKDLPAFASSFKNQPFLRNHDTRHIEARDGTIADAGLESDMFVQSIQITTSRGKKSFTEGQIDRFSIGWYFDAITCSVCNEDWFSSGCYHWPGQTYQVKDDEGNEEEILCELIFENPRGKETSAVNAPAVDGTGILSELCEHKRSIMKGDPPMPNQVPATEVEAEETPPVETPPVETPPVSAVEEPITPDTFQQPQTPAPEDNGHSENANAWLKHFQRNGVQMALQASNLPSAARTVVQDWANDQDELTPADLDHKIEQQQQLIAELREDSVIQGVGTPIDGAQVSGMLTSLDKIEEALTALVLGNRPKHGIRPLTGIREAYTLLSGDYDMRGMFVPQNVGLANVDSTVMAGIVANAMNKVVVNQFQTYPRFWEPIVTVQNFNSLQDARWITLGGVGELPTVSEGGAYTEMTWDDQTETDSFDKKGGYLGLTLEAIDKDDVSRIRQAPRALAQAAWLTLGKAIAAIFTNNSGTGPSMSDSNKLFDASNHSNLGTTALSFSAWSSTIQAMRDQTELNSGEPLGALVKPRYLLVPAELETTALQALMSAGETGTANNDESPFAEGDSRSARLAAARRRVIVVDFWTDANNWAAVADPNMYPSIGLGYRFGEVPEIFSVASPNSGLMFTNDVMPIKVRYFFAVGPTDWRGVYKHNVA